MPCLSDVLPQPRRAGKPTVWLCRGAAAVCGFSLGKWPPSPSLLSPSVPLVPRNERAAKTATTRCGGGSQHDCRQSEGCAAMQGVGDLKTVCALASSTTQRRRTASARQPQDQLRCVVAFPGLRGVSCACVACRRAKDQNFWNNTPPAPFGRPSTARRDSFSFSQSSKQWARAANATARLLPAVLHCATPAS